MSVDPAELAATHKAAFAPERGWSAAEFADLLAAPGTILSGDARSYVLGRVTLDEAEILTLATAPEHRREGRAVAALTAFHEAARAAGAASVFLEVADDNAAARALYAAADYVRVGRRPGYYPRPEGPPAGALVLRRTL